jgi:hypothetical protein
MNTHCACIFSTFTVASTNHARLDVAISSYTAAGVVRNEGYVDDLKNLRQGLCLVSHISPATHRTFDAITSDVLPQRDWLHSGIVCREVRTHLQTMFSGISPHIDNERILL